MREESRGPGSEEVRRWFLDKIALGVIDARHPDLVQNLIGFDIFGYCFDVEVTGEICDARDDLLFHTAIARQMPYEFTVHFQVVDAECLDILERRIPGAEIVDSESESILFEFHNEFFDELRIFDRVSLGDLEDEPGGFESVIPHHPPDRGHEIGKYQRLG